MDIDNCVHVGNGPSFSVLDTLILQNYFPHNNFKLGDLENEKNLKQKSRREKLGGKTRKL